MTARVVDLNIAREKREQSREAREIADKVVRLDVVAARRLAAWLRAESDGKEPA